MDRRKGTGHRPQAPGHRPRAHAAGLTLALVVAASVALAHLYAQQAAPAQTGATFRATARLIVQTVTVKDKDGKTIEGLTPKDFIVTEDGVPQDVAFAEFQKLPAPSRSGAVTLADERPAPPVAPAPTTSANAGAVPPPTDVKITSYAPGDPRYSNRRLLVLYFDLTAMPSQDLLRAYNGAREYISTEMTPADLVAVITFQSAGVQVKLNFTDAKDQLLDVIQTLAFGKDSDGSGLSDMLEEGTAFGQDDAEFAILDTDRQLSALQTAVEMLRPLPDQKLLLYFASGLKLNGVDNQAQLRATTNAALRANVSIYPVDARGLVATSPLGDATRASAGGTAMFSGQTAGTMMTAFQRSQDTLFSLAKDTGGKALLDFNDLSLGIVQAAESLTSYYIVGFYSGHTALDGKFHRVKISLNGTQNAELSYRQGYYADKEFAKFTDVDKERQLEEALMLDNPVTDLRMAMEVNYFQLNHAEYFIPVTVKIPGSELTQARRRGAAHTVIDFIGEVKDEAGSTVQNVRDKIDIKLTDETAAQLGTRPIQYDTGFTVLPGKYAIKFLARDAETGHVGTFLTTFVVPNLDRETAHVPISSVVLSSQRVPLGDALVSLQKNEVQAENPLVFDGQKLIPSVTRVFSKSRNLYVFLQAYERAATTTEPLVGFVTFYRGEEKALETPPLPVTDGLEPRSKAVPLKFNIALGSLSPGRYDVQVTIVNPGGQKVTYWRAPIVVVQ